LAFERNATSLIDLLEKARSELPMDFNASGDNPIGLVAVEQRATPQ
jgi:hypothetical protein